jgi:hypothetical protein
MHPALNEFRFSIKNKKSKVELNFLEACGLLREKPAIVNLGKYRFSSALLDFEGEI